MAEQKQIRTTLRAAAILKEIRNDHGGQNGNLLEAASKLLRVSDCDKARTEIGGRQDANRIVKMNPETRIRFKRLAVSTDQNLSDIVHLAVQRYQQELDRRNSK